MQISFSKWLKLDEEGGNALRGFADAMAPFIADNIVRQMGPQTKAVVDQAVKDSAAKTASDMKNQIGTQIQQGIQKGLNQLKTSMGNKTDPKQAVEPGKAFKPAIEQKPPATQYGRVNTPYSGDSETEKKMAAQAQKDMTRQYQGQPFGTGNPAPNAP
jgi:hypothetical protein